MLMAGDTRHPGTLPHHRPRPRAARRPPGAGLASGRRYRAVLARAPRRQPPGPAGPSGDVLVGFVGWLVAEEQVEDLAVLGDVPGVRLVGIGGGPEGERLSRRLPGAYFTGVLSGNGLSRAVASLDVVIHLGPYEMFCQAAQEAMASGVPVVAVGAGVLLDLVQQQPDGVALPAW